MRIKTVFTGVGRLAAERALLKTLETHTADCVFSCGFAGALDPGWSVGTVGFTTDHDALRTALLNAGAVPMRFLSLDRVAATAAEKAALRARTGADAVEMESAALQAICRTRNIPFAVVRAISDAATENLPLDFNRVLRASGHVDFGRLLMALARRPAAVVGLLRLHRQARRASTRLAEVLISVLGIST
ncbi:MAG: hypothetical protein N3I86_10565 [Verrucomicrobiae bacterium]|nr:hypothetical protein [Verrucomicrobiae bacterium]